LIIYYDWITITGYYEWQLQPCRNDNRRPFKNFTKVVPLKEYLEEGKIYIKDSGVLQVGTPYTYWDDTHPLDYMNIKILRFIF